MMKYIVHIGFNNPLESGMIKRFAFERGYVYKWEGLRNDIFKSADVIKNASLAVIWNGLQASTPLATRLCKRKGIPVCYMEWGLLPQSSTFMIDPFGFCGDSILAKDLSWITENDMNYLYQVREEVQKQYPLNPEGHLLAPLQIENDSQILYYSPYRTMEEFIADVETVAPGTKIVARPHPNSSATRLFTRARVSREGSFLEAASRASVVVGITSTCLYEAAILGVPVIALGDHPLRLQPKHLHDKVLAGALALRIDRATGDLGAVLKRFGINPL